MGRSVAPVDASPTSPAGADLVAARVDHAAFGANDAGAVPGERVWEGGAATRGWGEKHDKSVIYDMQRGPLPVSREVGSHQIGIVITCIFDEISPIDGKDSRRMLCPRLDCAIRLKATKLAMRSPRGPLLNRLADGTQPLEESAR